MTKMGAIWARISTPEQMSLESQIARAKEQLESAGYIVPPERILAADWSSLDLFSCPTFQTLRQWIQRKEIQALGILDRDRLEADGLQRLEFLADCRDAGIQLVICQGPPILDEEEGQLVELALTIGKKRSVLRAKLGAKDGLHDRAVKRRLPTSHHKVYGYKWNGKTPEELKLSRTLIPDDNWETVKLIFDMALHGSTYYPIIKELKRSGILSPSGIAEWNKAAISAILHNPIYAGRYYALKKEAVEPKKRKGNTYGNSSQRKLPLEESEYLPEIEIINPPITWEQRGQILHQLEVHQKLAKRNGRADYLLRGFILCETHRGKKGEPRRYHGQPHAKNSWRYTCPIGGCAHPYLNGPMIEETVKSHTWWLLNLQPEEFYRQIGDQSNIEQTRASLEKELRSLETKYNRNINAETELENRDLLGQVHPEVYRRLKKSYQAERLWVEERTQAIEHQLEQLSQQDKVVEAWREIRKRLSDRIGGYRKDGKFGDYLTNTDWRELFIALNLEVQVRDKENPATWANNWRINQDGRLVDGDGQPVDQCIPEQGDIEICFGIPPKIETDKVERIGEIVFNTPVPG